MSEMPSRLRALSDHLLVHPHLVEPSSMMYRASTLYIHRSPAQVLEWTCTMGTPLIEVHALRAGKLEHAHLSVVGAIDEHSFVVWTADPEGGDLWRWAGEPITMEMLQHYVQKGTTHHDRAS